MGQRTHNIFSLFNYMGKKRPRTYTVYVNIEIWRRLNYSNIFLVGRVNSFKTECEIELKGKPF